MLKRSFDVLISLALIIILSPVMLLSALIVMLKIGRPVIFRQERPGMNTHPFELIKLRTMSNEVDRNGALLSDDQRVTKTGDMLRRYSLDELPQLINVLKGDMSLVGPRPLLMEYLPLYNDEQKKRHLVRPGITGWAQVNGRNAITWDEKFNYDIWYVNNQSFILDLKILWLTLLKLIRRDGITYGNHVSMPKFTGNKAGSND